MRHLALALPLLALLALAATASAGHQCRTYPVDAPLLADATAVKACLYDSHDLEGWTGTVTGGRALTAGVRESLPAGPAVAHAAVEGGVTQAYYSSSIGSYLLTVAGVRADLALDGLGAPFAASAAAAYEQEQSTFGAPCTDAVEVQAATTATGTVSHREARPCEQALPLLPARPAALPTLP